MSETIQQMHDGVKVITPRHVLRERIGYGGIDPVALEKGEEIIKKTETEVDYPPMAREFLAKIENGIKSARAAPVRDRKTIAGITGPTMDLKASAGMFGYALLSEIADVILDFLEQLPTLNDDALDIADVHHKTLSAIVNSGMKGDGGREGLALSKELYGACQRYYKKYPSEKN